MTQSQPVVKMNHSYTILISLIVALGRFLLGFDSAVISGTVKGITEYFTMLGSAVGCVTFVAMAGTLPEKYGRKKGLIIVAGLFATSTTWSALATGYTKFIYCKGQ